MENVTHVLAENKQWRRGGGGQVRLGKLLSLSHIQTWYSELILKEQKLFFFLPRAVGKLNEYFQINNQTVQHPPLKKSIALGFY